MTSLSASAGEREIETQLGEFCAAFTGMQAQLQRVIVGQDEVVRQVLMAVFLQGHVLLEGVPGLGKTLLMNVLGEVLGLKTGRVQFTPDLMPADITGTRVLQQDEKGAVHFEYEKGPVFTQILLADEINRATPKTQSSLLEAMQERCVTANGTTYCLPEPFMVMATQNPLESEGTYPLPEAQLDRFMFKILVRFPTQLELIEIMKRTTGAPAEKAGPAPDSAGRIIAWGHLLRQVPVATPMLDFAARILLATHPGNGSVDAGVAKWIHAGASPRGMQAMVLAAKLRAVLNGRFAVGRDDLVEVAHPCLRHRIMLSFEAESEGIHTDDLIDQIIRRLS